MPSLALSWLYKLFDSRTHDLINEKVCKLFLMAFGNLSSLFSSLLGNIDWRTWTPTLITSIRAYVRIDHVWYFGLFRTHVESLDALSLPKHGQSLTTRIRETDHVQIFERLSIMPASITRTLAVDITAMRLKSLECNQLLLEVKSR